MENEQIRSHVLDVLRKQISRNEEHRQEALRDFMTVTMTASSDTTGDKLAAMVPPIIDDLYEKWMNMFVDRLQETVDNQALSLLCDGQAENDAALILAYVMFLESERMEKQIAKDLRAYAATQQGDVGDAAAEYIRARMTTVAEQAKKLQ